MSCPGSASSAETRLFDDPPATITAIVPMEDDPNLRAIDVDGKRSCVVRAADIDDLDLTVDTPWTDALAGDVQHRATLVDARQRALRLLGRKGYSSAQLRRKLETHFDGAVAAAAVAELGDDGWVDDRAVARDIVTGVLNRGPAGANLLREKLHKAGIDDRLTDEVIATSLHTDEQLERTVSYIQKQIRNDSADSSTLARRLAQRLARRGLDEEFIMRSMAAAGLAFE